MPVGLPSLPLMRPIAGISLGSVAAGIRKKGRLDLSLITLAPDSVVAGVFTLNAYCAPPVILCRQKLGQDIRALVINTGCANAGTGNIGKKNAEDVCQAVAELVGCRPEQVMPFSTGVIMEPLPVDAILRGLPQCNEILREDGWTDAATAILTTDTGPKALSLQVPMPSGNNITLTGIAKGAGMIHPNMATLLSFIGTDAKVARQDLQNLLAEAMEDSFNAISVDGDTSTNDSVILMASGKTGPLLTTGASGWNEFREAVFTMTTTLAQYVVRDGEGAEKFVTLHVRGGKNKEECRTVGFSIAHSPLVKTAFFASDPNLGRLLAAIGKSDIMGLQVHRIQLWLDGLLVVKDGQRNPGYEENLAADIMKNKEFTVTVDLGRGEASAVLWTCDLSHEYVRINAEYRS